MPRRPDGEGSRPAQEGARPDRARNRINRVPRRSIGQATIVAWSPALFPPLSAAEMLTSVTLMWTTALTGDDWLVPVTSGVAGLVGAAFVALTARDWPVLLSAVVGAPCVVAVGVVLTMFVLGIVSGIQAGWGIGATLASGLAAAVIYGFGGCIYAMPGTWLGGGVGAVIRHCRLRAFSRPVMAQP